MSRLKNLKNDPLAMVSFVIILLTIFSGIFAPFIAPHDPEEVNMNMRYAPTSWEYLLGNDHLGRCILSRIIFGIRPSVLWVLAALFASVLIGAVIGFAAGYFRGKVDAFLMRICDIVLSFPGYVMALAIIGVLGVGLENILIAFISIKWAWFARVIRTSVRQFADADYVKYARTIGKGHVGIMIRHIIPVTFADIAVITSSSISSMILQISGFSFLGLGVQAPTAEWGMMLNEAREVMFTRPELLLAPGLAIIIIVMAFNFFSDALQIALDPSTQLKKKARYTFIGKEVAESK